jgi:CubicO group peptidase (beta-lactamase class C family)
VLRARLDEYMRAYVASEDFSGVVLVARGGAVIFAQAYGSANVDGRVPNTLETRFRLGSITKPLTALAVLRLQERGALAVTDSVCRFVDPCPASWQPVTVHHLLSHTSGIPSFTSLADYRAHMHEPTTPAQTIARVSSMPLEFTPGDRFNYSNTGYVLLGMVIEKASGQPYARYLTAEVLEPLGMRNTGYESPEVTLAVGYAKGPGGDAAVPARPIHPTVPFAAGALYSTVGDLLRLDRAIAGRTLLNEATWKVLLTPV